MDNPTKLHYKKLPGIHSILKEKAKIDQITH